MSLGPKMQLYHGVQVLDLHKNCLEKLPEDIGRLTNLKVGK